MTPTQANNPLHGITLAHMLEALYSQLGWAGLARALPIQCFINQPSMSSSLTFLRRTPWARAQLEALYLATFHSPKG